MPVIDAEHPPERMRRVVSPAVLAARSARLLMLPFSQKLGEWQSESIKLETMALRKASTDEYRAGIVEAAIVLRRSVNEMAGELEKTAMDAPERVRQHSRVADARKVLEAMEKRLSALIDTMRA